MTLHQLGETVLWRITLMALRYRWELVLAFFAIIAASFFQLVIPRLLGESVDQSMMLLTEPNSVPDEIRFKLFITAGLLLGASVLRGCFAFVHTYLGESVGQRIGYQLRLEYYEQLQRLSFSYHDQVHTGDLITRGILDIEGVRSFVNTGLLRTIFLFILIGGGAFLMIRANLLLGLTSLSFVPFVGWRAIVARLKLRSNWLAMQDKMSILTKVMDENLSGIRVVRAFASQKYEMKKYDRASDEAMHLFNKQITTRVSNGTMMTFAFFVAMGFVLWIGGQQIIAGTMTVGELTSFLAFMSILQQPVRQIGMMVNSYARASSTGQRLFDVLDLVPDVRDAQGAQAVAPSESVLRFEHVSFAFPSAASVSVLQDISFEARPGHTIGIVGPPGSGKSTIAQLIPRFYDPGSGRITLNGVDIRSIQLESLRRMVSLVQQNTFLFTASVENNVSYGDPWAEYERIIGATQSAQLHDYIKRLPKGYDSMIGEQGVSLSGGQRQRLSIARSIMLQSGVVIFDDSTASIDTVTEQHIRNALKAASKNCATLIISHRLSSLMHADEILFIREGRIVERGSHEELLAEGSHYRELYELQVRPIEDSFLAASHQES